MLALRYLISGDFCIFPVGSGIEQFFRNYAAVLRFPACLSGGRCHRFRLSFHHSARPLAARAVSALIMSSVMSSVPAWLLAYRSAMSPVVLASPFPVRPSSSRFLAPLVVSGDGEPTGLLACLMMSLPAAWAFACPCFGCGAVPWLIAVPLSSLPAPLLRIG